MTIFLVATILFYVPLCLINVVPTGYLYTFNASIWNEVNAPFSTPAISYL